MRIAEIINSMPNVFQSCLKCLCGWRNNAIEPIVDHEGDYDQLSQSLGGIEDNEGEMPDMEIKGPNEAPMIPNAAIVPLTEFNLRTHELSEIIKQDTPEEDNDVLCLGSINGRSIYSVKSSISGISEINPLSHASNSAYKKQVGFVEVGHDISLSNSGSQQSDDARKVAKFKYTF